jgi:hypothetical protein
VTVSVRGSDLAIPRFMPLTYEEERRLNGGPESARVTNKEKGAKKRKIGPKQALFLLDTPHRAYLLYPFVLRANRNPVFSLFFQVQLPSKPK